MKVILRVDHESLGKAGEVHNVKAGYARNYLIPKKIAVEATPGNIQLLEREKKLDVVRQNKDKKLAVVQAAELEKVSLTATVQVGEEDKVFGSVTAQDIADLLKEKGFEIDKKKISLDEPIKALGVYNVSIKLHQDVDATIKVWVVKQ